MVPAEQLRDASNIKAIIFDVGGVLNEGSPDFIKAFENQGIKLQQDLWQNPKCKELILSFCTGVYGNTLESAQTFARELCTAAVGKEVDFARFKSAWNATILYLHDELIDKLPMLQKQGYRLFILSDTNMLHREYLETLYQRKHPAERFTALFERCYFSHETGNYKGFEEPRAKEAWLQILRENGLKPEECLFIDDKLSNVQKAEKLGIICLHYPPGSTSKTVLNKLDELNPIRILIDRKTFSEHIGRGDLEEFVGILNAHKMPYKFTSITIESASLQFFQKIKEVFETSNMEIYCHKTSHVNFSFVVVDSC